MATNISSNIVVNSSINQQQARFVFPFSFPLRFTKESVNIQFSETTTLTSSVNINAQIFKVLQIYSDVITTTDISSSINLNTSILGNLTSSVNIDGAVINNLIIVPQSIEANGAIQSVSSAMFTLVTNITANTTIALYGTMSQSLLCNFVSESSISGDLINLVVTIINAKFIRNINSSVSFKQNDYHISKHSYYIYHGIFNSNVLKLVYMGNISKQKTFINSVNLASQIPNIRENVKLKTSINQIVKVDTNVEFIDTNSPYYIRTTFTDMKIQTKF